MTRSSKATLLFGGDFCPIGRYEKGILASGTAFDDALGRVFAEHDFAMVNLEAPLCEPNIPADSPGGSGLRADPRLAEFIRSAGIAAVGLANNHIRDFGDEGVSQTMRSLDLAGVLHTGAGKDLDEAQQPLSVEVNGMTLGVWALAEKELNVASAERAGSSWFRPEQDVRRVEELRQEFDFLVVYLHAGHEFTHTPSPRIRQACRALVDAGADAVIAHPPHVVQGVERYRDALIAYSLGNLVFDSPYMSGYENTDQGFLVRLAVSPHRIDGVEIIPYKRGDQTVALLAGDEREAFFETFRELSENITDDARFEGAWEENVRFRWETEYRAILNNFSERFADPDNKDYARRAGNLFTCPTHVEMLETACSMLEQGKLSRSGGKMASNQRGRHEE